MARSTAKLITAELCSLLVLALASANAFADEDWRTAKKVGGTLTVYSFGESPFNHGAPFLQLDERRIFSDGSVAFRQNHSVGAEGVDGLGIEGNYNARSCETCHLRDGRGLSHTQAFEQTGFSVKAADDGSRVPIFRDLLSSSTSNRLQNVEWETRHRIELPGGATAELVAPVAVVDGKKKVVDLRNAPGVYGLGLLEAIPEDEIRNAAEKRQFSAFGVKGVVPSACRADRNEPCDRLGRFGWKGTVATLEAQTRIALASEIGIYEPAPVPASARRSEYDLLVSNLAQYLNMLAVPARRAVSTPEHMQGARLFEDTGCVMCHTPSWRTSAGQDTNARVREQQIYPFTDLLLHDMGEGLGDSMVTALAVSGAHPLSGASARKASSRTRSGICMMAGHAISSRRSFGTAAKRLIPSLASRTSPSKIGKGSSHLSVHCECGVMHGR